MTRPLAIDTHAHFFPPAYIDMISRLGGRCGTTVTKTEQGHYFIQVGLLLRTGPIVPAFYDLDQRIAEMDREGVDVHVISLTHWRTSARPRTSPRNSDGPSRKRSSTYSTMALDS